MSQSMIASLSRDVCQARGNVASKVSDFYCLYEWFCQAAEAMSL